MELKDKFMKMWKEHHLLDEETGVTQKYNKAKLRGRNRAEEQLRLTGSQSREFLWMEAMIPALVGSATTVVPPVFIFIVKNSFFVRINYSNLLIY